MRYNDKAYGKQLRVFLLLILLAFAITAIVKTTVRPGIHKKKWRHKFSIAKARGQNLRTISSKGNARRSNKSVASGKKLESESRNPERGLKASNNLNRESSTSQRDAKKQQAMSLLDDVLATTDRITPVDYKILAEVEGATLLWQFDKERSLPILKDAVEEMRALMDEEKNSTAKDGANNGKRQRLWFLALHKIAMLKPALIQELLPDDSTGGKAKQSIKEEWTEEARALMSAVSDKIAREFPRIVAIKDSRVRDEEYKKLAGDAALKSDVSLAMTMMSKIDDEDIRHETSIMVYSPIVRKAIKESDWSQAQKYASEILDPLGRSLAVETVAREMLQAGQDKILVKEVFVAIAGWLQHQTATAKVAKGLLILARSLHPIDPQASRDLMDSAISVLNKLPMTDDSLEGPPLTPALANWVRWTPNFRSEDESLDLFDMLEDVFGEMAKRDTSNAMLTADRLTQPGLYALARLAISKTLLEQTSNSPAAPRRTKAATK